MPRFEFAKHQPAMTNRRLPRPWHVVELPGGYAVEDASGRRLCTFRGRVAPNVARQAGVLTMEEARRRAVDFSRLPELFKREE
jgi:hypothetical protein